VLSASSGPSSQALIVKLPDLSDEELVGVWFHANAELHRPGPSCSSAFVSRSFGIGVGAGDGCPDLVGDSGDAQGGPTHDHFEWHPNVIPSNLHVSPYGVSIVGTAIDPYPYLNSAC
jgi:hypothetical protein